MAARAIGLGLDFAGPGRVRPIVLQKPREACTSQGQPPVEGEAAKKEGKQQEPSGVQNWTDDAQLM